VTVTEQIADVRRFCEQLLFSFNVGIYAEGIRRVLHFGKRGTMSASGTTSAPSTRQILIQLRNHTARTLIIENLYKLKSLQEKFKDVIITDDITQKERDECKALVA